MALSVPQQCGFSRSQVICQEKSLTLTKFRHRLRIALPRLHQTGLESNTIWPDSHKLWRYSTWLNYRRQPMIQVVAGEDFVLHSNLHRMLKSKHQRRSLRKRSLSRFLIASHLGFKSSSESWMQHNSHSAATAQIANSQSKSRSHLQKTLTICTLRIRPFSGQLMRWIKQPTSQYNSITRSIRVTLAFPKSKQSQHCTGVHWPISKRLSSTCSLTLAWLLRVQSKFICTRTCPSTAELTTTSLMAMRLAR